MDREQGFTLIETLVALAVFAVGAVALLAATERHLARVNDLEVRALAQLAAENHLASIEIGTAMPVSEAELLGHIFHVAVRRHPTTDPGLVRLSLTVTDADGVAVLDGFSGFKAEAGR